MAMVRSSRMLTYVNYRMKITLSDNRILIGTFMAFDRHMNIVLGKLHGEYFILSHHLMYTIGDTEEYRKVKAKKGSGVTLEREEKRVLGLIILRGDSVVSMTIQGPPPPEEGDVILPTGPGVANVAGRGLPIAPMGGAPVGLAGPVRGLGGPGASVLMPPVTGIQSLILHSSN